MGNTSAVSRLFLARPTYSRVLLDSKTALNSWLTAFPLN